MPLVEEVTRPDRTRGLRYAFHEGQLRAWESAKRTIAIIAGARSGKTSFGAPWLHREIARCGPGDYLVAAPSYPLLDKAAAPEIDYLFRRMLRLGVMKRAPLRFDFSEAGCKMLWGQVPDRQPRLLFGHADDPESLEAMTLKAAWLDEAGQARFKVGSWEAIQRRLSIDRGRCLITTTPYALGWLKSLIQDPWEAAGRNHPEIELVRFASTMNPVFPPEEFERARASLPAWKFAMFFLGQFSRPAGLIYDSFDRTRHTCPRFKIDDSWQRYLGLDFGGVNTAGIFFAEEPTTKKLYAYREYKAGSRDAAEHVKALLAGEPMVPICVGGSASEDRWRAEFREAGLPVQEPAVIGPDSVEVGIDRVYAAHRADQIIIFDDLEGYIDEKESYSRKVDDTGNVLKDIEGKSSYHRLDAERYIIGWVRRPAPVMEFFHIPRREAFVAPIAPSELKHSGYRYFSPTQGYQPLPTVNGEVVRGAPDLKTEDQAGAFLHIFARLTGQPAPSFPCPSLEPEEATQVETKAREFAQSKRLI